MNIQDIQPGQHMIWRCYQPIFQTVQRISAVVLWVTAGGRVVPAVPTGGGLRREVVVNAEDVQPTGPGTP